MIERYGYTRPQFVETKYLTNQQKQRTINFDIRPTDVGGYSYCWHSVTLEAGIWNYEAIISAIIRERYSADDVEALLCNLISDLSNKKYADEFNEFKCWREHAKIIASQAIMQIKYAY